MKRDEFSKDVVLELARRVGYLCSLCMKSTSGPHSDPSKSVRDGEAAHICAARKGGKRYNHSMTRAQRSSIHNGVWLCCACHKRIDSDEVRYSESYLHSLKSEAESKAFQRQSSSTHLGNERSVSVATQSVNLMLLRKQTKFFELCRLLMFRTSATFPVSYEHVDEDKAIGHVLCIREDRTVGGAVWQAKFTNDFGTTTKRSIVVSIANVQRWAKRRGTDAGMDTWTLCLPANPPVAFIQWLRNKVPNDWTWNVWGAKEIIEHLNISTDIRDRFFHESLRTTFAVDSLALVRQVLDSSCGWIYEDNDSSVLSFVPRRRLKSHDIVLDVIVRNRGPNTALLLAIEATVIEHRIKLAGFGRDEKDFLSVKEEYAVSIRGGEPGTYRLDCERVLKVGADAFQRFKVCIKDAPYGYTVIVVALVFDDDRRLKLPAFQLYA